MADDHRKTQMTDEEVGFVDFMNLIAATFATFRVTRPFLDPQPMQLLESHVSRACQLPNRTPDSQAVLRRCLEQMRNDVDRLESSQVH